jgi:hypothetical protein
MEVQQAKTLLEITKLINRTGLVPVLDAIFAYMDLESRSKELDEADKQSAKDIADKVDAFTNEISAMLTPAPTVCE